MPPPNPQNVVDRHINSFYNSQDNAKKEWDTRFHYFRKALTDAESQARNPNIWTTGSRKRIDREKLKDPQNRTTYEQIFKDIITADAMSLVGSIGGLDEFGTSALLEGYLGVGIPDIHNAIEYLGSKGELSFDNMTKAFEKALKTKQQGVMSVPMGKISRDDLDGILVRTGLSSNPDLIKNKIEVTDLANLLIQHKTDGQIGKSYLKEQPFYNH